jgi:hypothetical protein
MLTQIKDNQITFTDARFYIDRTTGEYYPSATTILEAYPKPYALLQWMKEAGSKADEIRDAAGRRGSAVHQLTEDYDNGIECNLLGENGQPNYSMEEWAMFERYVDFTAALKPNHVLIEQQVLSPILGFAGTIDRVCEIDGKKYVLDIKTSNGIYNSYWLQIAAYREALLVETKMAVDGVAILWLNAKTRTKKDMQGIGWQLVVKEDTRKDFQLFRSVQNLWLAEHEGDKPKQFSYTLSHKK